LKTERMLASDPAEKPLTVQLFGADPQIMAAAARKVEAAGADIVDLNFGCAVRKVLKTGAGAALMHDPERAESVIKAVRQAVTVPLTVKCRSGWDRTGEEAFRLAEIAQKCRVDALALHPRTAPQGFSGQADWQLIAGLKRCCDVPVIGNGDIASHEDALKMKNGTDCDAVMVGRAAIGNPWLFSQIRAALSGDPLPPPPALADRFEVMRQYLRAAVAYRGEQQACRNMRSRLGWFVKALPHNSRFREAIKKVADQKTAEALIDRYHHFLMDNGVK